MSTPQGSGGVRTYLAGAPARATVGADLMPVFDPPLAPPGVQQIDVDAAGFLVDDYVVLNGVPQARGTAEARALTRVGIGDYFFSNVPPAPNAVDTKATIRWLPTSDSFIQDDSWKPSKGSGITLLAGNSPYLDKAYTFDVRGGDSVTLPAVIFRDGAWMQLSDTGWSAQTFTFVLAAVMHQNPNGPVFGLFESFTPTLPSPADPLSTDDPAPSSVVDWGVRYRQGTIEMWAGSTVVSHEVQLPQSRVMVVAVSMDPTAGRLFVVDRNKSTRSFSTDGMSLFGIQLFLGRLGTGFDLGSTAYMDVLEFDYFDHALDFDQLADVVHTLDELYGVVG